MTWTLWGLTPARGVSGAVVSARLMAEMMGFRRRFSAFAQMRANACKLMAGSMGMVASALPVQTPARVPDPAYRRQQTQGLLARKEAQSGRPSM